MVFNWTRKVITKANGYWDFGFSASQLKILTWTFHNDGDPCCRWESQKQPYPLNQLIVDPHCTDEYLSPRRTNENNKQTNKQTWNHCYFIASHFIVMFMHHFPQFFLLWWWYCRVICVNFFLQRKVTVREIEQARLWSTCRRFTMMMKREWAIGDCEIDSNMLYRTWFWFVSFFRLREKMECSRGSGK